MNIFVVCILLRNSAASKTGRNRDGKRQWLTAHLDIIPGQEAMLIMNDLPLGHHIDQTQQFIKAFIFSALGGFAARLESAV